MKKWFRKQENAAFQSSALPETPYQRAKQEWDERIGAARVQAKNWRFMAVLSILVAVISLIMLAVSLTLNKNQVFVAQVTKGGRVVNTMPLKTPYKPTVAQEEYFLTHFVKLVRSISLDPVVAKKNWMTAYHFLTQRSSEELNRYFKQTDPLKSLGQKTITVNITDTNPISDNSYQVDWTETTIGLDGQTQGKKDFSGVFTLMVKQPTKQAVIFDNPLGIYITDFHISSREKL